MLPESLLKPPGTLRENEKGSNFAFYCEKETFHADDKRFNFMIWLYGIFFFSVGKTRFLVVRQGVKIFYRYPSAEIRIHCYESASGDLNARQGWEPLIPRRPHPQELVLLGAQCEYETDQGGIFVYSKLALSLMVYLIYFLLMEQFLDLFKNWADNVENSYLPCTQFSVSLTSYTCMVYFFVIINEPILT